MYILVSIKNYFAVNLVLVIVSIWFLTYISNYKNSSIISKYNNLY